MTIVRKHAENTVAALLLAMALLTACGGSADLADTLGGGGGAVEDSSTGGHRDIAPPDIARPDTAVLQDAADASGCEEGTRRCGSLGESQVCQSGHWAPDENCPALNLVCIDGACVDPPVCVPGEVRGCMDETSRAVCNATGEAFESAACPEGQFCLQGECGDQLCRPGSTRCADLTTVETCDELGEAWGSPRPCGEGSVCNDGACVSGCEEAIKLSSYIGCEYWTVDLDNYPDPFSSPMPDEVPHSVVISNPGYVPAVIQFKTANGGEIAIDDPIVPPGGVRSFTMPRADIADTGIFTNAVQILSSYPVNAYQFNPLNNEAVYSNDGSLLLPANTLGRRYIAASWPSGASMGGMPGLPDLKAQQGYFTVVAVQRGTTTVTVTVTGDVNETPPELLTSGVTSVGPLTSGDTAVFTLEQFQVLNLEAAGADFSTMTTFDLTGSTIQSDKPIAVFGGHEEAVISYRSGDSCCADHLEEQLIPVQVWRDEVLCVKMRPRSASGEKDLWRVLSGADGNHITTAPSIGGLDGIDLDYGEWVEIATDLSFEVSGSGKLMAVQYVVSQQQTDDMVGDPAMVLAVPVGQYRNDYNILVPDGYAENWVTVIRPTGLQIKVDGLPTTATFTPFGGGDWEFGYVSLEEGRHEIFGAYPFGLIAYGWDDAVSYGYPAGLNLRAEDWAPTQ